MLHQNLQNPVTPKKGKSKKPKQLFGYQLFLLKILSSLIRLWSSTLRYKLGPEVRDIIEQSLQPVVVILWHNRLFAVPEFYRRYVSNRKLAAIVSANKTGAWLSGLFEQMGIMPIRGSRNRRGVQAFREMIEANKSGYDVGITPDGSRGPMYEMKAGATMLAFRSGAPIVLLSYDFKNAFRLNSWDRFYVPYPFSRVEVRMELIERGKELLGDDVEQAAKTLKTHLDAITMEEYDDLYGEVI